MHGYVIAKLSGEDIYHFLARSIGSSLAGGNRGNISTQVQNAVFSDAELTARIGKNGLKLMSRFSYFSFFSDECRPFDFASE